MRWDQVGGLEETKQALLDAYFYALADGARTLPNSRNCNFLLVGPPGTGKTLLAAAIAGELQATFFQANPAVLLSMYFGQSSKNIATLYDAADELAPSVIFFDEIDALAGARHDSQSGVERRVLTQLLQELDGLTRKDNERLVMSLAATNRPWDLDEAFVRRFKPVHVPLPDATARRSILTILLGTLELRGSLDQLVQLTDGYSGSELAQIVGDVVRHMLAGANPDRDKVASQGVGAIRQYKLQVRPLEMTWFVEQTRQRPRSTSSETCRQYEQWIRERK